MDGELEDSDAAGRMITQLKKNDELKSCWENYHLIGDCIRKQLSHAFHGGIADRITALLEHEPHHFGRPASKTHSPRRFSDKAGFALAASISAVAMLGMLQVNQQNLVSANETTPVAYETDIQHQALAMDTTADTLAPQSADETQAMNIETPALAYASFDSVDDTGYSTDLAAADSSVEDSVYDYLVNYSQYAVSAPLQGTVPATVIGYYSNL